MYNNLFRYLFLSSIVIAVIGAFLKLSHFPFAQVILLLAFLFTIGYVVVGLIEINRSTKISDTNKIIWTICLITFNFVTAIFYLINRKNII